MIVQNQTQKKILSKNLKIANSFADKLFGLVNKSNPRSLMFITRFGVHTFFLKDKVDILVLDGKNKVKVAQTVLPNRIFFYNPRFSKVIEFPFGTILKTKTKIGDRINLSDRI